MSSLAWAAAAILGLGGLAILGFLADFVWLGGRWLAYGWRHPDERGERWIRSFIGEAWAVTLYKWLPTPRIRITGARPAVQEIYNGQMLDRVAQCWNDLLRRRPAFEKRGGGVRLDQSRLAATRSKLEPRNQGLMAARARSLAPYGELAEGAYALGYCLARVFAAGTNSDWQENAQRVTSEYLVQNDQGYEQVGLFVSDYAGVPSEGFWRELELRSLWNRLTIEALRWAYRDQVRRWEQAEGTSMGKGVGFAPLEELKLVERFDELLFEHGARFFETETGIDALQRQESSQR